MLFRSHGWHGAANQGGGQRRGLVPGVIIALSILWNAGRRMILVKRAAEQEGRAPAWTGFDALASISGFSLLHLAMLFVLDLHQAAAVWPLTAFLVLCGALYMAQTPLAVFALFMQGLSAVLYLQGHQESASNLFTNWNFATQLSLAVAAILTADRMRHEAQRLRLAIQALSTTEGRAQRRQAWLNPWCESAVMQWVPLIWGVVWWLIALNPLVLASVVSSAHNDVIMMALVAVEIELLLFPPNDLMVHQNAQGNVCELFCPTSHNIRQNQLGRLVV